MNGQAKADFDPAFRSSTLGFMASTPLVYRTMCPNLQSLAKLCNRGVLTSTNDHVLILNDDLCIDSHVKNACFEQFEGVLNNTPSKIFTINGTFSRFAISRDERLLGLGEEDVDFCWRYHETFDVEIPSFDVRNIDNVSSDISDGTYTKEIRTAAKFNREFIKTEKYQYPWFRGYKVMFDNRVIRSCWMKINTLMRSSTRLTGICHEHYFSC